METASVSRRRSDEYSAYDSDSDLACREDSQPAVETQHADVATASEFLICHSPATARDLGPEFAPVADDNDAVREETPTAGWPTQSPPSANDLSDDKRVRQELSKAWQDSFVKRPGEKLPHEEGGWIYGQPGTTDLMFIRGHRGAQMDRDSDHMEIDLTDPPVHAGWFVVADYHTHPGSTVDPGYAGDSPSRDDYESNRRAGVPGLVRTSNGGHLDTMLVEPPDRRRYGYSGPGGYPGYGQ